MIQFDADISSQQNLNDQPTSQGLLLSPFQGYSLRNGKSPVWSYFMFNKNIKSGICCICLRKIMKIKKVQDPNKLDLRKYGNIIFQMPDFTTKRLINHLKSYHGNRKILISKMLQHQRQLMKNSGSSQFDNFQFNKNQRQINFKYNQDQYYLNQNKQPQIFNSQQKRDKRYQNFEKGYQKSQIDFDPINTRFIFQDSDNEFQNFIMNFSAQNQFQLKESFKPKCKSNYEAKYVCINKDCSHKNAFICSNQNQKCYEDHQLCSLVSWTFLLKRIQLFSKNKQKNNQNSELKQVYYSLLRAIKQIQNLLNFDVKKTQMQQLIQNSQITPYKKGKIRQLINESMNQAIANQSYNPNLKDIQIKLQQSRSRIVQYLKLFKQQRNKISSFQLNNQSNLSSFINGKCKIQQDSQFKNNGLTAKVSKNFNDLKKTKNQIQQGYNKIDQKYERDQKSKIKQKIKYKDNNEKQLRNILKQIESVNKNQIIQKQQ